MNKAFVMDTNAIISAALIAGSVNSKAFNRVLHDGFLAFSESSFFEFIEVLYRPKFDKYLSNERRSQIIARIEQNAKWFEPAESITVCRDADDNMLLEVAVASHAYCIITGDKALQELHPF